MDELILGDPHVPAASDSPNLIRLSLAKHVSLRRNGQIVLCKRKHGKSKDPRRRCHIAADWAIHHMRGNDLVIDVLASTGYTVPVE